LKNILYIAFLIGIFTSCQNKTGKFSRTVKVYENDSLKTEMQYELTISKIDSGFIYNYENLSDNKKNMTFKYIKSKNRLHIHSANLGLYSVGNYSFKKTDSKEFDLFVETELMLDGHGPVLFNEKYGVLSSDNGWGVDFLFLPTESSNEMDKEVLKNISVN